MLSIDLLNPAGICYLCGSMPDVLDIWKQDWGAEMTSALQEEVIRHVMRRRDAPVVSPRCRDRIKALTTLNIMKAIWMILSLVFGLLFFALGCSLRADIVQYFGVLVMIPGLIGLCDALWPEKEGAE